MSKQRVVVLDFGGQYNELIARRVREAGVYCEVQPYFKPMESYMGSDLKGIILTGGPQSACQEMLCLPELLQAGIPILGICYGMQVIAQLLGGQVQPAQAGEFGFAQLSPGAHILFEDVENPTGVWMNHCDQVIRLPDGFTVLAKTESCPIAAIGDDAHKLYGLQFHPEVNHTAQGNRILRNFLFKICHCEGGWEAANQADTLITQIREQTRGGKLLCALSGGVDSSVAAVLAHQAIGDRLVCVFVDHGLLRENEAQQVMEVYGRRLGLHIIKVDAGERFLSKLKGVTDPEQKRKIIGGEFIRVFEAQAHKIGADYLLQGTIYPDVIESGVGPSAVIKSHHNVGGLPEDIGFKGIVEPLRMLFKDEVRALGERLGIPHELVWRQPFPGPGLAIRVVGEITHEKLTTLRRADAIFREEVAKAGLDRGIWQYFAVHTGVRSVGVMGDKRTYDHVIALRAVTSTDAMTVQSAQIPHEMLGRIASRIINEVQGVNRVVYDITSKPPGTIEWE